MGFTAVAAVFETYEILESILHKLPMKDLLFAQKVCKTFKQIIGRSGKLQRALFFKQVPAKTQKVASQGNGKRSSRPRSHN